MGRRCHLGLTHPSAGRMILKDLRGRASLYSQSNRYLICRFLVNGSREINPQCDSIAHRCKSNGDLLSFQFFDRRRRGLEILTNCCRSDLTVIFVVEPLGYQHS
jgi:hypothetical protein